MIFCVRRFTRVNHPEHFHRTAPTRSIEPSAACMLAMRLSPQSFAPHSPDRWSAPARLCPLSDVVGGPTPDRKALPLARSPRHVTRRFRARAVWPSRARFSIVTSSSISFRYGKWRTRFISHQCSQFRYGDNLGERLLATGAGSGYKVTVSTGNGSGGRESTAITIAETLATHIA